MDNLTKKNKRIRSYKIKSSELRNLNSIKENEQETWQHELKRLKEEKDQLNELLQKRESTLQGMKDVFYEEKQMNEKEIEMLKLKLKELDDCAKHEKEKAEQLEKEKERLKIIVDRKDTELVEIRKQLNSLHKDKDRLTKWLDDLQVGISELLSSNRWKMGNALGELQRKLLLKPNVPMPAKFIEKVLGQYNDWKRL